MNVQLTLPALERLLGGDTELETQLRHQVVENFAKRHLLKIVRDDAWKKTVEKIEAEVKGQTAANVAEVFESATASTVKTSSGYHVSLRGCIIEAIQKRAWEEVNKAMISAVSGLDGAIDRRVKTAIDECVKKAVVTVSEELIKEKVQNALDAKLQAAVDFEVKRRLDMAKEISGWPTVATSEKKSEAA